MEIDRAACRETWQAYLQSLPPEHPHRAIKPDAFGFGGEPKLADELAELVLAGKKRATSSLPIEYTARQRPLPQLGDLSLILRGDGRPAAIIERTSVTTVPFEEVDEAYAAIEGEGDGSLAFWRRAHDWYFRKVCAQLGGELEPRSLVLCQVFRVVWRAG